MSGEGRINCIAVRVFIEWNLVANFLFVGVVWCYSLDVGGGALCMAVRHFGGASGCG